MQRYASAWRSVADETGDDRRSWDRVSYKINNVIGLPRYTYGSEINKAWKLAEIFNVSPLPIQERFDWQQDMVPLDQYRDELYLQAEIFDRQFLDNSRVTGVVLTDFASQ